MQLSAGLLDVVDILTVEPCFAKQEIQLEALAKVRAIKELAQGADVRVIVDGGINEKTVRQAFESGADTLVSGSYVFGHRGGVKAGVESLLKMR